MENFATFSKEALHLILQLYIQFRTFETRISYFEGALGLISAITDSINCELIYGPIMVTIYPLQLILVMDAKI